MVTRFPKVLANPLPGDGNPVGALPRRARHCVVDCCMDGPLEIVTLPGTPGDRIDNNPELELGPQRLVVWILLVNRPGVAGAVL